MRILSGPGWVKLWASARDTWDWAHRPRASWPCSFLAGNRFFAEFDRSGLVDLAINSGRGEQDCPADEFTACCQDLLAGGIPEGVNV